MRNQYSNDACLADRMKKLEDFMNWLTDMDWGWWPVVSWRPPKDRDIDNWLVFKLSILFGPLVGLLVLGSLLLQRKAAASAATIADSVLCGWVAFFIAYKSTCAHFWNRRARRLRSGTDSDDDRRD